MSLLTSTQAAVSEVNETTNEALLFGLGSAANLSRPNPDSTLTDFPPVGNLAPRVPEVELSDYVETELKPALSDQRAHEILALDPSETERTSQLKVIPAAAASSLAALDSSEASREMKRVMSFTAPTAFEDARKKGVRGRTLEVKGARPTDDVATGSELDDEALVLEEESGTFEVSKPARELTAKAPADSTGEFDLEDVLEMVPLNSEAMKAAAAVAARPPTMEIGDTDLEEVKIVAARLEAGEVSQGAAFQSAPVAIPAAPNSHAVPSMAVLASLDVPLEALESSPLPNRTLRLSALSNQTPAPPAQVWPAPSQVTPAPVQHATAIMTPAPYAAAYASVPPVATSIRPPTESVPSFVPKRNWAAIGAVAGIAGLAVVGLVWGLTSSPTKQISAASMSARAANEGITNEESPNANAPTGVLPETVTTTEATVSTKPAAPVIPSSESVSVSSLPRESAPTAPNKARSAAPHKKRWQSNW